jgi:hypothetical protein
MIWRVLLIGMMALTALLGVCLIAAVVLAGQAERNLLAQNTLLKTTHRRS